MRFLLSVFALLLVTSNTSVPAVINVPDDQPTIQLGIDAATDGDTVLVAPGSYTEALVISGKAIKLFSQFGPAFTALRGTSINVSGNSGSETVIKGFSFTAGSNRYITVTGASLKVRENYMTGYSGPDVCIRSNSASSLRVEQNLFYKNGGISCVGVYSGQVEIINNTFDSNARGFFRIGGSATALNNIVTNSTDYGIFGSYMLQDYNDVWNNNPDYSGSATAGAHNLSVDPLYTDPANADYSLQFASPCIDAGDPDPIFNDLDGTRNDMGALSVIRTSPFISTVILAGENKFHVVNHTPQFNWIFFDTAGLQLSYEIEVGLDTDWTIAELWATGEVFSSDSFLTYSGLPLIDGQTYFVRIRGKSISGLTGWAVSTFRMNTAPLRPIPFSPVAGDSIHYQRVILVVSNSEDAENDPLKYDFEIFADPSLMSLVGSEAGVIEQENVTASDTALSLSSNATYWWRARSTDGFEQSAWSIIESFITRSAAVLRVPDEFQTIQSAIDASFHGDTVLVSDGTYRGPGNRDLIYDGRSIVLLSENGPAFTTIDCQGSASEPHQGVIFQNNEDSSAILDGFTIQGGYAPIDSRINRSIGGAILCDIATGPVIRNCIFRNNLADLGGAVYLIASDAAIINCQFRDNHNSPGLGDGVYGGAFGTAGGGMASVKGCLFENNHSGDNSAGGFGGAVYLGGLFYGGTVTFSECVFQSNTASLTGGAGASVGGAATPAVIFDNCVFNNNNAPQAGALFVNGAIRNSTFINNSATSVSGACELLGGSITDCSFRNNRVTISVASTGGGALSVSGTTTISGCDFVGNRARIGGAIKIRPKARTTIRNSSFRNNFGSDFGGAISSDGAVVNLINCKFAGNTAGKFGGSIFCFASTLNSDTCEFIRSVADSGLAIGLNSSTATIQNATLFRNSSSSGSVIHLTSASNCSIANTLLAFNSVQEPVICADTFGTIDIVCSDIFGNAGGDWIGCLAPFADSSGNLNLNPWFCDLETGSIGLSEISPCVAENNSCGTLIGARAVECNALCGDADANGIVDMDDVLFLVDFYFHHGPRPISFNTGDVNCDELIDLLDIVYLTYFVNGTIPELCCASSPRRPDRPRLYYEERDIR